MVPSSRLLLWLALVGLPLFLMAGMDSSTSLLWEAVLGCFFLAVVLDLGVSLGRLDGLGVECPKVQRLIQDQEGNLELFLLNPDQKAKRIRLGLALPRTLETPAPDLVVEMPSGATRSRILWPVTPRERGQLFLDKSHLEISSWLGFWDLRRALPTKVEARVYPNLSGEKKGLAALFLNRGGYGVHAQRQMGRGREFDKLREYMHGDSYADIHWKATARRNHPVTKIFQIERTQEVYVVVDASRLSGRPAGGRRAEDSHGPQVSMLERFLTASLVLRVAAEKQGDLFGLITFSDKVHGFLPAKNGRAHYNACRDALYTLKPRRVTPDFDELFTTLRLKLRRRALLFFLTSLDDPLLADQFSKNIGLISRQHLVMVNMIAPKGARPLFEEDDRPGEIDLYSRLGGHLLWHRLRELEKTLKSRGVTFSALKNERFSVELVTQYINLKQRQLL